MSAVGRVLVVDDDPVVARSFNRVLSSKGYAVIAAQNGEDTLRKLSSEIYDLVFTNIKMPGITWLEIVDRVKASQPWRSLAYLLATPFIGLAAMAWFDAKVLDAKVCTSETAQRVVLSISIAAPFIGLAFVVAKPVVGIGSLAWLGSRAMFKD